MVDRKVRKAVVGVVGQVEVVRAVVAATAVVVAGVAMVAVVVVERVWHRKTLQVRRSGVEDEGVGAVYMQADGALRRQQHEYPPQRRRIQTMTADKEM